MIELSRTIFFSRSDTRISPVKLSSISLPSCFLISYFLFLVSPPPCEIMRIKRTSATRRFLRMAYLLTVRGSRRAIAFHQQRYTKIPQLLQFRSVSCDSRLARLFKTHDPPRRAWNNDKRVFRAVSPSNFHPYFFHRFPPILIPYVAFINVTFVTIFQNEIEIYTSPCNLRDRKIVRID